MNEKKQTYTYLYNLFGNLEIKLKHNKTRKEINLFYIRTKT